MTTATLRIGTAKENTKEIKVESKFRAGQKIRLEIVGIIEAVKIENNLSGGQIFSCVVKVKSGDSFPDTMAFVREDELTLVEETESDAESNIQE